MLSIVAETIKLSVNSSVSRLTKYETDCLALFISYFKSFSIFFAVDINIFIENVDDRNMENITKNKLSFIEQINIIITNKAQQQMTVNSVVKNPDNLFLYLINIFLKKLINLPIITTG